jgi:SAM-dependent methyltransferase
MSLWDSLYTYDDSYFGDRPSILARESLRFFKDAGCKRILEFSCGQGRDTVFFANNGLKVHAVDFSGVSIVQPGNSLANLGLERLVRISQVDLSRDLPRIAPREVIDAVYSNLFYCMPFSDEVLQRLFDFVCHTLRKGGLHIFWFRNKKKDKSFGRGGKLRRTLSKSTVSGCDSTHMKRYYDSFMGSRLSG